MDDLATLMQGVHLVTHYSPSDAARFGVSAERDRWQGAFANDADLRSGVTKLLNLLGPRAIPIARFVNEEVCAMQQHSHETGLPLPLELVGEVVRAESPRFTVTEIVLAERARLSRSTTSFAQVRCGKRRADITSLCRALCRTQTAASSGVHLSGGLRAWLISESRASPVGNHCSSNARRRSGGAC